MQYDKPPPYTPMPQEPPPYPTQQGAAPPPGFVPNYGSTTRITVEPTPPTQVIIIGGCPHCHAGVLEDDFSCLGIFCAIFFFPIGILCCLALRQRRCPNCGAVFS